MLTHLTTKPDFDQSLARFEAWWQGELIDRPPVTLWARERRSQTAVPPIRGVTERDRWLDVERVVDRAVAWLQGTHFLGDSIPIYWPNIGPEITSTLFGCELEFSPTTSWSRPVVHEAGDWEKVIATPANFANPYWQVAEAMTRYALQRCENQYVVGMTDLHGNYDILAGLRDPQTLCMDLIDCPDLVRRAGRHVAEGFVQAFNRNHALVAAGGHPSTCWTPFLHAGRAYVTSCDFWCMVGPEQARDLILPDIRLEMSPLDRSMFHLDGPGAIPHLDLLLPLPTLHAVQWVFTPGQGPAHRWLELYRRILSADKAIQVLAVDAADALAVLEAVGPKGLWLCVNEAFNTVDEANAFLKTVERLTAAA